MKLFSMLILCFSFSAHAFQVDISKANVRVVNNQEIMIQNMKMAQLSEPVWGRLQWNSQTNSFALVDFATTKISSPEGNWEMTFDMNCDGQPGRTTWSLKSDGTCTSGDNRMCEWSNNNSQFRLTYTTGGRTEYVGKWDASMMTGTFSSASGVKGCWSAVKMERLSLGLVGNQVDRGTGLDSSGSRR